MKNYLTPLPFLLATAAAAAPSLTIYNGDLAVIREALPLDLKAGENSASFDHATAQVVPDSVVLRDPEDKRAFSILEQGYRNDPVSEAMLLSRFEGQTIDFRIAYPDGKIEEKPGKIVRSGYAPGGTPQEPVIEMDGKLLFALPGRPLFPDLGGDSILRPTLSWRLSSEAAEKFNAQLAYVSHGFGWEASYNAVATETGDTISLTGWVTVSNHSGAAFTDARLKLVAGDVNVIQEAAPDMAKDERFGIEDAMDAAIPKAVTEKAFDDFHLYSIGRPLTIRDKETKQVEFLHAPKVKAVKKYVYDPEGGEGGPKKVASYWEFRNDEASGLGMPLPAGRVRFYRADGKDGNLEFVGENKIAHTPKDENLSLLTGYAFDLTGERKVVNQVRQGSQRWTEDSVEIVVRNHSKSARQVILREHAPGGMEWKLTKNSDPFQKSNSRQFEFTVNLAPDEEKKVTYTLHQSW